MMSEIDRARREIHGSAIAQLLLGGAAAATLQLAPPQVAAAVCFAALAPWLYAVVTAGRVARAAATETKEDAAKTAPTIREYTLITLLPLFGLVLAPRVFRGEVGGGTQTVNGATSSIPVYSVGSLGRALALRMVCFNLSFMGAYAAALVGGI